MKKFVAVLLAAVLCLSFAACGGDKATDKTVDAAAMFQALLPLVDGIQPDIADGIHGPASVANVRWLQRRAGLTENGIMCLQTWNALTRLYEIMITADPELLSPGRG